MEAFPVPTIYFVLSGVTLYLSILAFGQRLPERYRWEVGLQYSLLAGIFLALALSKTALELQHPLTFHWTVRVLTAMYGLLLLEIILRWWYVVLRARRRHE